MSRRKVVTTVNLPPEIYEQGREEGLNFSKILERGIIDSFDPTREIQLLKVELHQKEKDILGIKERIELLELAEQKVNNVLFENLVDDIRPFYELHGFIDDRVLARYSLKFNKPIKELEEELLCVL